MRRGRSIFDKNRIPKCIPRIRRGKYDLENGERKKIQLETIFKRARAITNVGQRVDICNFAKRKKKEKKNRGYFQVGISNVQFSKTCLFHHPFFSPIFFRSAGHHRSLFSIDVRHRYEMTSNSLKIVEIIREERYSFFFYIHMKKYIYFFCYAFYLMVMFVSRGIGF